MQDLITTKQRLGGYKPMKLKIAIYVLLVGLIFNVIVISLTTLTNRATAEYNFTHAHTGNFVHMHS